VAARPGRPLVGILWIRAQAATARDATDRLTDGSAVVLAPHPDDETLACGLLLATLVARESPVDVVLATDGRRGWFADGPEPAADAVARQRLAEWHRALDALGVPAAARHTLGFADAELGDHEDEAERRIARLLAALAPDRVFVSAPDDLHSDHRALARATCRAVVGAPATEPRPELVAYQVYPDAGLRPAGRYDEASTCRTLIRMARSMPRLVSDRALAVTAPDAVMAKSRAVAAHASQKLLLDRELRHLWRGDTELFRSLDPVAGAGGAAPGAGPGQAD
jgi:LmbE family N-acetylglucosaminyl deacetylase